MPWDVDPSEPIISPSRTLDYYRELPGGGQGQLDLPVLMVATFQRMALERLVDHIGGPDLVRWPGPAFWPLARGTFKEREIAVSRLPMGAPAASAAMELMIAAGVKTIVVVGSAGSIQPAIPTGSLVLATGALRHEGTSHHYLSGEAVSTPDPILVEALLTAARAKGLPSPAVGQLWTTDAIYRECTDTVARCRAEGYLAVEMEAAALFTVARHRGVRAAQVVAISDELHDGWKPGFHTLAYRRAILTAADLALEAAVLPAQM